MTDRVTRTRIRDIQEINMSKEMQRIHRAQIVAMAQAYKDARRDMRKAGLL